LRADWVSMIPEFRASRSPDWIVCLDAAGTIRYACPAFREATLAQDADTSWWVEFVHHIHEESQEELSRCLHGLGNSRLFVFATLRMSLPNRPSVRGEWAFATAVSASASDNMIIGLCCEVGDHAQGGDSLHRKIRIEASLADAAVKLLSPDATPLTDILGSVARAVAVDRAYIFSVEPDGRTMSNTHEWCAPGILSEIRNLQNLSIAQFPWWMEKLHSGEVIAFSDVSHMPQEAGAERSILEEQGIQSVLVLPFRSDTPVLSGFLGFDSVRDRREWSQADIRALELLTNMVAEYLERKAATRRLSTLHQGLVLSLSQMVDIRDPYTAEHQTNVAKLARAIAEQLALPEEEIEMLHVAGLLHDIGKLTIPSELLSKTSKLSETELAIVRTHVECGHAILSKIPFESQIPDLVLQHHERLDGSGYPSGLHGRSILLGSRILAVADVVEAITHHRPYRPARGLHEALEVLASGAEVKFDSRVVEACYEVLLGGRFSF